MPDKLSDTAVHDLADALRGLPEALENLNERVEHAATQEAMQVEFERQRLALEKEADARKEDFEKSARQRRTIMVLVIFIVMLVGFSVIGIIVKGISDKVNRATGSGQAQVTQDVLSVIRAQQDCDNEKNLQQFMNALSTSLGKPTVIVFNPPDDCKGALEEALAQLALDQQKFGRGTVPTSPSTTTPTAGRSSPSSGPGAASGTPGPTATPGTTTTTTPPRSTPSPTTTTTTVPTTTTTTTILPLPSPPVPAVCITVLGQPACLHGLDHLYQAHLLGARR